MIRRLYDWVLRLAGRKDAEWALAGVSFAESSFFPLPPDLMLIPMCIARRERAYWFAFICTIASVLGGLLGYTIGAFLYDTVGQWLIKIYGMQAKADDFHAMYAEYGLWVIMIKGLTPIPYKLVTIVSGIAHFNIGVFVAASIVTRGFRFFLVAFLIRQFGAPIQAFIEKRLTLVFTVILIFVVGGYALLKYV